MGELTHNQRLCGCVTEHQATIETLRAENVRYKTGVCCPGCDHLRLQLGEMRAENVRLREALQKLVDAVERDNGSRDGTCIAALAYLEQARTALRGDIGGRDDG